jgi:DNA repair exonuclease SbcCD ATPase subunit
MKKLLTKEEVEKAIADLTAHGRKITLATLHAALGNRGSLSTLVRLKAEIETPAVSPQDSEGALSAFRQVWGLAQTEARKQQEVLIAELQETIRTLATENERLDGLANAAERRCVELEQAKSAAESGVLEIRAKLESELSRAQGALSDANAQAARALEKLAKTQSDHAIELATLKQTLSETLAKTHAQEIQLVRAETLATKKTR